MNVTTAIILSHLIAYTIFYKLRGHDGRWDYAEIQQHGISPSIFQDSQWTPNLPVAEISDETSTWHCILERPANHQVIGWLFLFHLISEEPLLPHLNKPILDLVIAFSPCHSSISNTFVVLTKWFISHTTLLPDPPKNEGNGLVKFTGIMNITIKKHQVYWMWNVLLKTHTVIVPVGLLHLVRLRCFPT